MTLSNEQVYVPQDFHDLNRSQELELAMFQEKARVKRIIIHWSFVAGIIVVPFLALLGTAVVTSS